MKKIFIPMISLLSLATLVGCNETKEPSSQESKESEVSSSVDTSSYVEPDFSSLKIAAPKGAPAIALYDMHDKSNVEINSPDNVLAYLDAASDKDIVIAPTNALKSKIMAGNAPYKISAILTFGNFYIASTGNDDNDTFDKDDYIVLFQQNGLPDKLFKYTYGTDYSNLHYVSEANDANKCLMDGINATDNNNSVDYVLVPQPALTAGLTKAKQNRPEKADKIKQVKDVQEDYKTKSNNSVITQAALFVKPTTDQSKINLINQFLLHVDTTVKGVLKDTTALETKLAGLTDAQIAAKFGAPNINILKSTIKTNSIGLGYEIATDFKVNVDAFLKNLGFINEDTSENLYY